MSGEAVVITAVASPVGLAVVAAAAAVVVAGSLAAKAIEEERRRREAEAWQQHQQAIARLDSLRKHRQRQQDEEQQRTRYEQLLLRLSACQEPATPAQDVAVQGYLSPDDNQRVLLEELEAIAADAPPELQGPDQPVGRLQARLARLRQHYEQGKSLQHEALITLQATLESTIRLQLQQQETREAMQQAMLEKAEALLQQVMHYSHLAADESQASELASLQGHIEQWLQGDDRSPATLDVLASKMEELKATIDALNQARDTREVLRQRMHVHLQDMGYTWLEDEGHGRSLWRIPGGERVSIALQDDFRIGFQLQHERSDALAAGEELAHEEARFLRKQETRWCGDLKQLIRQLVADGFQYSLQFERELPQDAIPVVVVDDAASWEREAAESRADVPKARHLS